MERGLATDMTIRATGVRIMPRDEAPMKRWRSSQRSGHIPMETVRRCCSRWEWNTGAAQSGGRCVPSMTSLGIGRWCGW